MNNIPEGATHVRRIGGRAIQFFKKDGGEWYISLNFGVSNWAKYNIEENELVPVADMRQQPQTTTAPSILEAAAGHMRDRAATYDKPEGERSMGATVQAFKAVTGHELTEEQGWLFMQLLKAVRSQQGAYRADSYEDGAAYVALAGEAAARDRQEGQQTDGETQCTQ